MTPTHAPAKTLIPWSLFAALIAAAGLPIYIHAPTVYAETYGIALACICLALWPTTSMATRILIATHSLGATGSPHHAPARRAPGPRT